MGFGLIQRSDVSPESDTLMAPTNFKISRRSRHGPWHEIDCSTVYWRRLWCQLEGGFDPSRNSWHSTKNYQSQFWIGFCWRTPQLSFIYQQFLRPRLLLTLQLSIFWTQKTNDRSQNQQFFRHSEILISILRNRKLSMTFSDMLIRIKKTEIKSSNKMIRIELFDITNNLFFLMAMLFFIILCE